MQKLFEKKKLPCEITQEERIRQDKLWRVRKCKAIFENAHFEDILHSLVDAKKEDRSAQAITHHSIPELHCKKDHHSLFRSQELTKRGWGSPEVSEESDEEEAFNFLTTQEIHKLITGDFSK